MCLAVWGDRGCCKMSAADRWEMVRLILLLLSLVCVFTVIGWLAVVQGVMMSIDNAWHANPAAPTIESRTTELSPGYPPHYPTFKDDQRIRTNMPKVQVHCYLQILTVTDCN